MFIKFVCDELHRSGYLKGYFTFREVTPKKAILKTVASKDQVLIWNGFARRGLKFHGTETSSKEIASLSNLYTVDLPTPTSLAISVAPMPFS